MRRNITVLVGSARKNGNTEALADAFIGGAAEAGHSVNKITLYDKNVSPCTDCRYCFHHDGRCALRDDMSAICDAFMATDILALATPLYFFNFSAQIKCVLDRLHNPVRDRFPIRGTVLLSVCTGAGIDTFDPLVRTYGAIGRYLHWEDRGMVLIDGAQEKGAVLRHPKLEEARRLGLSL